MNNNCNEFVFCNFWCRIDLLGCIVCMEALNTGYGQSFTLLAGI